MFVNVNYEVIQEFLTTIEIDEAEFREWAEIGPKDPIDNTDLEAFITSSVDSPGETIESGTPPILRHTSVDVMNAQYMGDH